MRMLIGGLIILSFAGSGVAENVSSPSRDEVIRGLTEEEISALQQFADRFRAGIVGGNFLGEVTPYLVERMAGGGMLQRRVEPGDPNLLSKTYVSLRLHLQWCALTHRL